MIYLSALDVIAESTRNNPYPASCGQIGVNGAMGFFKRRLQIRNIAIVSFSFLLSAFFPAISFSASPSFSIEPPPAWILPPPVVAEGKTQQEEVGLGAKHLFFDSQIRVSSGSVDRYFCRSKKVLSSAHLEEAAKLELEFEPSYQKLVIHYIRIRRGLQTINALKPKEIRVIQRESELDQQLYNGTLSAVVFVNDVRVGDIIEYAYSVNGLNPIFRANYSTTFYLAQYEPAAMLRFRLLWPTGLPLHIKNHNTQLKPSIHIQNQNTEYIWLLKDVPAIADEDRIPDWYQPVPWIQVSEFDSWKKVIEWALPLYAVDRRLSPQLSRQIEIWRSNLPDPGARFLAVLRFVQDEVRYL